MVPMSWLLLVLAFVMTFLVFNSIKYFSFSYIPQDLLKNILIS